MIDVLKRLAELDAQNPNIVKEAKVEECGITSGMSQPHTPATINITADSGEELTGMLKDIMSLSGMKQVSPADLGHEHEPSVMTGEPGVSIANPDVQQLDMKGMIAKMDALNTPSNDSDLDSDNDETELKKADETVNSLSSPEMVPVPPGTQDPAGTPGAADGRNLKNHPVASPEATYESLMSEYRKFISEDEQSVDEGSKHASRPGTEKRPGSADQAQQAVDRKKEVKADYEKRKADAEKKMDENESLDIIKLAGLK